MGTNRAPRTRLGQCPQKAAKCADLVVPRRRRGLAGASTVQAFKGPFRRDKMTIGCAETGFLGAGNGGGTGKPPSQFHWRFPVAG